MTAAELREFVIDYVDGRIFALTHIHEAQQAHLAHIVFMPLIFPDVPLENVGNVYEYRSAALSRSVNGYPTFASCRLIHEEDWKRAIPSIKALHEARAKERETLALLDDDEEDV